MPRVITLEDAGLFQMVCHFDGLSHPPGYPLFTLICNQLAWPTSVFFGNFISTIFALCTLIVFYLLVKNLTKDSETALVAAFAYAFSATFWSQAIVIEVYSLAAFLFIFSWWLLLKYSQTENVSYWYLFCFMTALGLSNHWPLHILSGVGLAGIFFSCRKFFLQQLRRPRFVLYSILLLLLGLSPYVSLLTNQDPEIAIFGAVTTESFFDYVSRDYYSDVHESADYGDKLSFLLWMIPESVLQLGVVAIPFILLGLGRSKWDLSFIDSSSLVILYLMTTFVLMLLINFKFDLLYQAIFKPYPIIAYAPLSVWFAIGISFATKYVGRRYKLAILILVAVSILSANFQKVDRSSSRIVDDYGRLILNSLPEKAVLFVQGDNETGPIGYLNRVEGLRSDVTIYDVHSLVFRNRLTSVKVTNLTLENAYKDFLKSSERPVFRVSGGEYNTVSYGLYSQVATLGSVDDWQSTQQQYVLDVQFDRFIDYLLSLHGNDLLFDSHEQRFVYNILIAYTKTYLSYGSRNKYSEEQRDRLTQLQLTFPGMLITLGHQLRLNEDASRLLPLAESLMQKETAYWPTPHLALSYEYYGLVLERLDRLSEAAKKFEKSLEINKVESNLSHCHLARVKDVPSEATPEGCP
ncbi:MAG: hypothetical protein ACI9FB_002306 [Candidatus Azotimanducaceae bacterium]|jgi:hypothetical protein